MGRDNEAYMPRDMVLRVLEAAGPDLILVGGQALAFWMDHYGIQAPRGSAPAVSRDVDFLTRDPAGRDPLRSFARAIDGRPEFVEPEAITALVGSAIAPAEPGRIYNVDLLHRVVGIDRDKVFANAVRVPLADTGTTLRVMHPLDVLQSRNANLHVLAEKQDDVGKMQFRLAIEVARSYLEQEIAASLARAAEAGGAKAARRAEREIFDAIAIVAEYSTEDAARKNAERHDIHLADAIPAWKIATPAFWTKQWPHLRERMSPGYAASCEARASLRRSGIPG